MVSVPMTGSGTMKIEPEESRAEHDARERDRRKAEKVEQLAAAQPRLVHKISDRRDQSMTTDGRTDAEHGAVQHRRDRLAVVGNRLE